MACNCFKNNIRIESSLRLRTVFPILIVFFPRMLLFLKLDCIGIQLVDNRVEMSRNVQSGNTQNLKSSAAPVRLPAAPASTPGTSQAAAQAGCVYRP